MGCPLMDQNQRVLGAMVRFYARSLAVVLDYRALTLLAAGVFLVGSLALAANIPAKDAPLKEDIRLLGRLLGDVIRQQLHPDHGGGARARERRRRVGVHLGEGDEFGQDARELASDGRHDRDATGADADCLVTPLGGRW
mgnify:CR=1 FL=1